MDSRAIISADHLTKTYRTAKKSEGVYGALRGLFHREYSTMPAVADISFEIMPAEFIGFIGPNGAGKTTTLKMLSGILWPTSGSASVLGSIPWHRKKEMQIHMGIVLGQKNQLWWDLPARDTFLLNKEIYEISKADYKTRIHDMGETLAVSHLFDIPVRKLSLGERMKCELVNSLLHYPSVLFLDEPTIGLDVISQKSIRDFLKQWNKDKGTTIILTSHLMDDVEELCPRIIMIHSGTLQYDGSITDLMRQHATHKEITLTLVREVSKKSLEQYGELTSLSSVRATYRVAREDVKDMAKKLLDALPVVDITIEEIPLEDVIRDIFLNVKK
ncbi:MAG: ATP-binding cassette domain-containing protein [Patescibacteria group bacterium]